MGSLHLIARGTIMSEDKKAKAINTALKQDAYLKSKIRKTVITSITSDSGLTKNQIKQYFG